VGPDASRRGLLIGGLLLTGAIGGLLRPTPARAADGPPIIDCAGWGSRPIETAVKVWDKRPLRILVHHTATPNVGDYSRGAAEKLARAVQSFHMDRRGWIDTGQHFTISRGGFVLEGRHRSLEVLRGGSRQVEGAHCTGQNDVAVGIENEGTYTSVDPPTDQWDRLRELCTYICQQYGIGPKEITGHRDFKDTACPGDALYAMLPRLRSEVAGQLGQQLAAREAERVSWPLLREADEGPVVQAAQHLMRAAGLSEVPADGHFDVRTADAVRAFQQTHRTEEINGLLGGESWPLLVVASNRNPIEVGQAVRALTPSGTVRASSLPVVEEWLRMLDAAARR
jgi:N-acetylmuramoyl-L-alanine amidase-like protein/putative peptidoglycan binding protein